MLGLDNLDTSDCIAPCQMSQVVDVADAGFNSDTLQADYAVATIDPPVRFTDEVCRNSFITTNTISTLRLANDHSLTC